MATTNFCYSFLLPINLHCKTICPASFSMVFGFLMFWYYCKIFLFRIIVAHMTFISYSVLLDISDVVNNNFQAYLKQGFNEWHSKFVKGRRLSSNKHLMNCVKQKDYI